MPVLSSKVLRSTQVFMAVLSPVDVIRRVYVEKYKTHGDTSSANFRHHDLYPDFRFDPCVNLS